MIKSGGEWISTIDLENLAVGHRKVATATVKIQKITLRKQFHDYRLPSAQAAE